MASRPLVSIIVVSFNTREMTLACLRSVYAETNAPFELIIVDNASDDGSVEAIASEFPEVRLIAETTNLGFAVANNLAGKLAKGDYLLLLNPDTVVLRGSIDKLLAFAEKRPQAKLWGGRTVFADGALNPTSCWRRMSLWSLFCQAIGLTTVFRQSALFNPEGYGAWRRDTEREVDTVTGCFLMIKRVDWDALNGFDEKYLMYGEDADLSLRAQRRLGARPRITPDAEIVHHQGASEHVRVEKLIRLLSAKITLIEDHFPPRSIWLGNLLLCLWPLSRAAFNHLAFRSDAGNAWYSACRRNNEWRDGWTKRSVLEGGEPR